MGYCTVDDVELDFRDVDFSTSTVLTTVKVQGFIDDNTAMIDSKLANRYITPVTGVESLKVLKKICVDFTASKCRSILYRQREMIPENKGQKDYKSQGKQASDDLDSLVKGESILIDAVLKNSSLGIKGFQSSSGYERKFDIEKKQW